MSDWVLNVNRQKQVCYYEINQKAVTLYGNIIRIY